MTAVHAEVYISQLSGEPIRVGCLCDGRGDHGPLVAAFQLIDDPAAASAVPTS
ncbi:hypothetical protein ACFVU2_01160 [Leifsonia sp. NPDC058194]|uniref:hypothetical protein n=1 Tax=Leifsonia sp. NPDC058194 TaxID=3346374 RepID=UPI0036DD8DFD